MDNGSFPNDLGPRIPLPPKKRLYDRAGRDEVIEKEGGRKTAWPKWVGGLDPQRLAKGKERPLSLLSKAH